MQSAKKSFLRKFMNNGLAGAIVFLCLATLTGAWLGHRSWQGAIYLSNTGARLRNPAAVPPKVDVWTLYRTQESLVESARKTVEEDRIGVVFGHFLARDPEGRKVQACSLYERLIVHFEAEGILEFSHSSDDGEGENAKKAAMTIDSPCFSEDNRLLDPIWIPVRRILGEEPRNGNLYFDDPNVHFAFSSMPSEWPKVWRLVSVELLSSDPNAAEIVYEGEELRQHLITPLILDWNKLN